MKYTIKTNKHKLIINADSVSLNDILLLVAEYYGEEWYGCCVSDELGNFICNPVKEYFTEGDPTKSVYQWAIEQANGANRMRAKLVDVYVEPNGDRTYNYGYDPFTTVEVIK